MTEIQEVEDRPLEELTPMEVAARFESLSRRAKALGAELATLKKRIEQVHDVLLALIEKGELPHSFKMPSGANIHLQTQLWASAKDKDHARLAAVLKDLGLNEYLPKTVNSHSISAYVREHLDDLGQLRVQSEEDPDGLPQSLIDALNISEVNTVKTTGL